MGNIKKIITMVLLSNSMTAVAAYNGPMITKSSFSGYTPEEWRMVETCDVYQDRVEIIHQYGSNSLGIKEIRKVAISGEKTLADLVLLAEHEPIDKTENGLCDGPSTVTTGVKVLSGDALSKVIMFSTGGCGTPRQQRNGPYSNMIRDFVGQYCQKNFDNQ